MVLRMTNPTRRKDSSQIQYRKRVPADIQKIAMGRKFSISLSPAKLDEPPLQVNITIGSEVKFSLKTSDDDIARIKSSEASLKLEKIWQMLRQGPVSLSHKQMMALSKKAYDFMIALYDDNPGTPEFQLVIDYHNLCALQGDFHGSYRLRSDFDSLTEEQKLALSLNERYGALLDVILNNEGIEITPEQRPVLLKHVGEAVLQASGININKSVGDYSPDPCANRFPQLEGLQVKAKAPKLSLKETFKQWCDEARKRNIADSTIYDYKSRINRFAIFLGHDDLNKITSDDIVRYKDHRLTEVSPKTVQDSDLATLRSIFSWAIDNKIIETNPAEGIKVKTQQKIIERPQSFTDEEAQLILNAAYKYTGSAQESHVISSAKKWIPWLCAYTGARVGELIQLRKIDVFQEKDLWVIRITPAAGAVKNKKSRDIPLHSHLIDLGFIEFIGASKTEYLFLKGSEKCEIQKQVNTTKNRLRDFIRKYVTDKRVQPNHGWRHRFKTIGRDNEIDSSVLNAICGHSDNSVANSYGEFSVTALSKAIEKLPRYKIDL